jgi:Predicted membrane-bound dolichyl-phosphate-mannose-protein mannosyltransferase
LPNEKLIGRLAPAKANALRALVLALASLALFIPRLSVPGAYIYDELPYISSARALLGGTADTNPEHPPLGKVLIAASIKLFGDHPFGWRFASVLAGVGIVVGMFYLGLRLLGNPSLAMLAAVLTLLNHFTFVMARVAMLEVFILMFAVTGVAAWMAAVRGWYPRTMLAWAGVMLGCSISVKWSSIAVLGVVGAITLALWVRKRLLVGIGFAAFSLCFLPLVTYYLSFWPLLRSQHAALSVAEVVRRSQFIWHFHQHAFGNRGLNSPWYQWVFRTEPERALNYLVGNWAVCWLGIAALLYCVICLCRKPALEETVVVALFAGSWLQWALIPRPFEYYYYYSLAATFLCLAVPTALRRAPGYRVFGVRLSLINVVAVALLFVVFYPKMTALEAPWDCAIVCISCVMRVSPI